MAKTKIFVSFDYETDLELKGDLISQAERPDSPFSITDFSLQETQPDSTWLSKAQSSIARCEVFVVLLGENTHNAPGVLKEIRIAKGLKKRRFQLRPQSKKWNPMKGAGEFVVWTCPGDCMKWMALNGEEPLYTIHPRSSHLGNRRASRCQGRAGQGCDPDQEGIPAYPHISRLRTGQAAPRGPRPRAGSSVP